MSQQEEVTQNQQPNGHGKKQDESERTRHLPYQQSYKPKEEEDLTSCSNRYCNFMTRFYLKFVLLPVIVAVMYVIALLLPPDARAKAPLLLWANGGLTRTEEGTLYFCPRESICSEGILQIFLIATSRLTAFASYVFMAHTFLSKMHCTIHAVSKTYLGTLIPFPTLHNVHKMAGRWFGGLILVHTIAHLTRFTLRGNLTSVLFGSTVGISGLVGVGCIVMTIISMSPWARRAEFLTFEVRAASHYVFSITLIFAMAFHSPRCRIVTLVFSGLWFLDKLYGICFKTYRLDIVEFSPLPGRVGVQMLWRNPPGFNASSGEYVKVQIPWLSRGGSEWHPFSVYLREETAEGLDEVLRVNTTPERTHFNGGVVVPSGKRISPSSSTAVLLCEYQNEFASERGKLHEGVKTVMESTNMLQNTVNLVEYARTVGAHIFHLPRTALEENGIDNSNKNVSQFFSENTWNAEIVDCLKPDTSDIVIRNKKGLDGFNGTNLQEQLQNKGIDTIIIGGFLANCCVESTMRTGYEMGYNVITLEDGSACTSQEEQDASIQFTWKMFSTPMRCSDATKILGGVIPDRFQDADEDFLFQRSEDLPLSTCSISSSDRSSADEEKGLLSLDTLGEELHDSAGDLVLRSFITHHHRTIITGGQIDVDSPNNTVKSLIKDEARQESRSQYTTTQVFMAPVGDWTKEVYDEVYHQRQLRHCWVKGPFVSPYSVVSKFSHLVLVASGIGITPALGVMGNYKGSSRTKVLVWTTRCPKMIKFFAPLLEDAAMAIIYYTGKEKFSAAELNRLTQGRNIYIQQSRPDNMTRTVGTVISSISSEEMAGVDEWQANSVLDIPRKMRQQWCILYCGGSTKIHDMLSDYSKEVDVQFHTEMFDW